MKAQLRKVIPAMLALFTLNAAAVTRYVDLNSPSPTPPYTNWPTAATNIQDAIDAADVGDQVLVTNGVYATGGRLVYGALTNRVAVTKPISLASVNGPAVTAIEGFRLTTGSGVGDNAIRCVYLTNGVVLSGFTLTNGATRNFSGGDVIREQSGGALWCETNGTVIVSNCTLINSSAAYYGGGLFGGTLYDCRLFTNRAYISAGAYRSTLNNCIIASNRASYFSGGVYQSTLNNCKLIANVAGDGNGGGAFECTLTNCMLTGNSAKGGTGGGGAANSSLWNCTVVSNSASPSGGGLFFSSSASGAQINNCIVFNNTAPSGSNYASSLGPFLIINFSCITPMPANGIGNITNGPAFVDFANGDFSLASNSPCINAGRNMYIANGTDLDGDQRFVDGTVDMGAYEFQSPSSVLSYAWAQQYGLPTDGSADFTDNDDDGHNNWQEWRADTNPTNALSVLQIINASNSPTGLDVTWQSVSTRNYWLERATNLNNVPPFQSIATNIPGASSTKTYTDTSATNGGPYFYRVGVQ